MLTKPTISSKLREIFSDQLLVRGRDGMVPTERALAAVSRAQVLLADLVDATAPFDASSSNHGFTIASPDYMAPVFLSEIVDQIRRKAPNASLVIRALGPDFDFEGALARGEVDVVIGDWPSPPAYLKRPILLQDDIVCLMQDSHPLAEGEFTEADYLAAAHIVPVAYSMAHRGVVETHLSSLRVSRARTVALSYFTTAPRLLLQSDLIFSTSRHFASFFAGALTARRAPAADRVPADGLSHALARSFASFTDAPLVARDHHAGAQQDRHVGFGVKPVVPQRPQVRGHRRMSSPCRWRTHRVADHQVGSQQDFRF
ncbi:LysR substrate-binding domain-containing protein [Ensifer adhaerens]|uniref:LysR substrate-binding domain-containing protein n=1 Tax=Ensifer adhaerens TaxID=106592 RepID=UPI001CC128B2|nr:LysR substrate-binding domain-containing protein [Ensifer adhaerens]UAX95231.1 hypothetical protein LAC78_30540 [Ensifer adhaerens]